MAIRAHTVYNKHNLQAMETFRDNRILIYDGNFVHDVA